MQHCTIEPRCPSPARASRLGGRIIDRRYRVERQLGAGGMGVVYRAIPLDGGQPVAIKVLQPRFAHDDTYRRRFVREARVAASIEHPNVIRVLDFGQTKSGRIFSVMEYLSGVDLERWLRREGPLSWSQARPLLQQVILGLRAAHERGVLHRDIKPSNVFLVRGREGCSDHARLLDFGLAKAVDPTSSLAEGLTLTDEVMGTADYVAPERLFGRPADARSDLYSVGVMAYRMLCGSLPRWGEDTGLRMLLSRTRRPPPSVLDHRDDLPSAVDHLIRRAMAVDPDARFSSLHHLEREMMRIPVDGDSTLPEHPAPEPSYAEAPTQPLPRETHTSAITKPIPTTAEPTTDPTRSTSPLSLLRPLAPTTGRRRRPRRRPLAPSSMTFESLR